MNCHRDISNTVVADFPTTALTLIDNPGGKPDEAERAIEIHTLFTEADHGFVNPISDNSYKDLKSKINYERWDDHSGYPGISIFNEYTTWAL